MAREFRYESDYESYDVNVRVGTYAGEPRIAVELVAAHDDPEKDLCAGEPITSLTVNLPWNEAGFCEAYIDVNNASGAKEFLKRTKLAKPLGWAGKSGFCSYPAYGFNKAMLAECDPEGFAEYCEECGMTEESSPSM